MHSAVIRSNTVYTHLLSGAIYDSSVTYETFVVVVNTVAAEVLYTKIAEWCHATPETIVLDICCGTGTIGQTVAKVTLFVDILEYKICCRT